MSSVPGFLPSTSAPLFGNSPWPPGLDLSISIDGLPSWVPSRHRTTPNGASDGSPCQG